MGGLLVSERKIVRGLDNVLGVMRELMCERDRWGGGEGRERKIECWG